MTAPLLGPALPVPAAPSPLLTGPGRPDPVPLRAPHGLADRLAAHGDAPALLDGDTAVSYRDLAGRVRDTARRLGPVRRLVLLPAANDVATVVTLLGALHGSHPVLLVPEEGEARRSLLQAYDPDVVVEPGGVLQVRREGTAHALHPDLALLLSTSGSTGSPKLVRLSHTNVWSNAGAIADYLGIRREDRAVTTLPLAYCYGLSVLTSHLLRGAAVVLTDLSVADPCFWDLFRRRRATTFAGVPYTFDLLDRVGFAGMDLPSLRYVTQAGGRLAPERVRAYAELGRRCGWDLFVMYGQTEATARMAWLPPDLAATRPEAVGLPVPGSSLAVEGAGEDGVGELVFRGPGVMMGYAATPADLALPAGPDVLRTGDLGRRADDGLFEVVGRSRPFAKVFGLRVDLARVEAALGAQGLSGCCLEVDGRLHVAVEDDADPAAVRRAAAASCGLPPRAVQAHVLPALPRRSNGKVDQPALRALLAAAPAPGTGEEPGTADPVEAVRRVYAQVLERDDVADDATFVGLGGDSLSYVEASLRLERLLGDVPAGWHTRTVAELAAVAPTVAGAGSPARRGRRVETSVLLRALAIVLIVGSHADLFTVMGGAHVLLAVAGFNLARFQLSAPRAELGRRLVRSAARVWVPTAVWVGGVLAVGSGYSVLNLLMLNGLLGPDRWGPTWRLWFLEVLVVLLLATAALLQVPAVDRLRRRAPFGVAASAAALALLVRFDVVSPDLGPDVLHSAHTTAWLFALGWAGAEARSRLQRLAVTAACVLAVPGWFEGDTVRAGVTLTGLLLLLWLPSLRVPRAVAAAAGALAASSLYVYVSHWQVYPHLEDRGWHLAAVVASFAVGLTYWRLARATGQLASRWSFTSMRVAARGTPAV